MKPMLPYRVARAAWHRGFTPLALNPFLQWMPPGHFYSAIPSVDDVARRATGTIASLPGMDLRDPEQLALASHLATHLPVTHDRSTFINPYFGYADGTALWCLLRHLRPSRIVEVGSGFSTAMMLDACGADLTCIEPYPDRLRSLLRPSDRVRVLAQPVQDVPLETFTALQSGDWLFIDSSHVVKVGSDVLFLLTDVLPRLASGVIVHVHDIFWPFEYPADWLAEGRAWNEAYLLKAVVQSPRYEILWFNSYLRTHHPDVLASTLPDCLRDHGGSIYLRVA